MSSSLYNERCKVLFILSTVVILLSTIKTGSATVLMDLPLNISSKSAYINATLTDIDGTNQYFIQEWISASDASIRGGIVISGEKDSYNIYYNTDYYIREFRLVIHGTDCTSLSYQNNVFQTLPGIDKPVTNLLLLMGPSILYRLGHSSLVWKSVEDKNIRGTMMKGVTTEINGRLNITYYYKKHFDDDYGIKHPSRIEFSGCDPYSSSLLNKENLILDIYLQNENDYDQLASEVHPLPGIGCSGYLSKQIQVPKLKTDYVHYTMYEYIQGSNTSRTFSEIHASEKHKLLRLKSTLLGVTTESIYDHNLGVSYLFQENGSCSILPADLNSPGIKSTGFDWESLFFFDSYFSYIGKLNLEHRSGHPLDVWESVRYPRVTGKKVVITHYYAKSQDSEIFYDHYTLVSTKITNYQYDSSMKTYNLTDAITRDYMNFDKAGSEDELHDEFTLKGCKDLISNKTLTLSFKLQPEGDIRTAERQTESRFYELERPFLFNIILSENISPLRINTVQYNFNGTQIEMEVTFLDKPNFQYIFNSKTMPVSAVAFENMEVRIKANDEYECLDKLSKMNDHIEAIIYRPSDSTCGYLKVDYYLEEDIEESKEPCIVYHFPLRNFDRINQELPLNQIYNTLLKKVDQLYPLITESDDFFIRFQFYKLIDVVHKTKNQDDHFQSNIRVDAKLKSNDQVTVTAPDAKTLADCYRTCLNSEQLKCNIFSFCQNGDCRVSSLFTEDSDNDTYVEQDKACAIYTLNVLND